MNERRAVAFALYMVALYGGMVLLGLFAPPWTAIIYAAGAFVGYFGRAGIVG